MRIVLPSHPLTDTLQLPSILQELAYREWKSGPFSMVGDLKHFNEELTLIITNLVLHNLKFEFSNDYQTIKISDYNNKWEYHFSPDIHYININEEFGTIHAYNENTTEPMKVVKGNKRFYYKFLHFSDVLSMYYAPQLELCLTTLNHTPISNLYPSDCVEIKRSETNQTWYILTGSGESNNPIGVGTFSENTITNKVNNAIVAHYPYYFIAFPKNKEDNMINFVHKLPKKFYKLYTESKIDIYEGKIEYETGLFVTGKKNLEYLGSTILFPYPLNPHNSNDILVINRPLMFNEIIKKLPRVHT